ncbi:hypothetical protein NE562_11495 [Butyricicoccus faecihominis]|uniref:hypothetical protein n=1 Tax=Butyricicoccus faecihominis TaxID=1712515 RepID=UPI00247A9C1C|nr:hypothetical protein [Butyricicoccus faecihominis]MCQ5130288.1 hypothetical protein [Butyricicoccus faecihominis]
MVNTIGSGIWAPGTDMFVNGGFWVNQRAQASYRVPHNTYTVDRWKSNLDAQIDVVSDGIKVHSLGIAYSGVWQITDALFLRAGDTFTFSAIFPEAPPPGWYIDAQAVRGSDGTGAGGNNTIGHDLQQGLNTLSFTMPTGTYGVHYIRCFICNCSTEDTVAHLHRAKLEPGPISTLMYDAPPDMAVEEARCKRYFERLGNWNSSQLTDYEYIQEGSAQGVFTINYSTKRVIPTVKLSSADQYRIIFRNPVNGSVVSAETPTDIAVNDVMKTIATISTAIPNISATVLGMLQRNDGSTSPWIDIDAEIY